VLVCNMQCIRTTDMQTTLTDNLIHLIMCLLFVLTAAALAKDVLDVLQLTVTYTATSWA
jgi:hypothetical protein